MVAALFPNECPYELLCLIKKYAWVNVLNFIVYAKKLKIIINHFFINSANNDESSEELYIKLVISENLLFFAFFLR